MLTFVLLDVSKEMAPDSQSLGESFALRYRFGGHDSPLSGDCTKCTNLKIHA